MQCSRWMVRLCVAIVMVAAVSPAVSAADKKAPDPAKVFAKKDADNDGALTLEEYKAGLKEQAPEKIDKRFKKIDANGDGKLSLEEFKAGMPAKKK